MSPTSGPRLIYAAAGHACLCPLLRMARLPVQQPHVAYAQFRRPSASSPKDRPAGTAQRAGPPRHDPFLPRGRTPPVRRLGRGRRLLNRRHQPFPFFTWAWRLEFDVRQNARNGRPCSTGSKSDPRFSAPSNARDCRLVCSRFMPHRLRRVMIGQDAALHGTEYRDGFLTVTDGIRLRLSRLSGQRRTCADPLPSGSYAQQPRLRPIRGRILAALSRDRARLSRARRQRS